MDKEIKVLSNQPTKMFVCDVCNIFHEKEYIRIEYGTFNLFLCPNCGTDEQINRFINAIKKSELRKKYNVI